MPLRRRSASWQNRFLLDSDSTKDYLSEACGFQTAEVVVVGAGIVGLTAAYLLAKAGLSVVVVEARRIGRQVTGGSTAKITTQHSLIYRHLIRILDLETAQHYADANRLGMDQIETFG